VDGVETFSSVGNGWTQKKEKSTNEEVVSGGGSMVRRRMSKKPGEDTGTEITGAGIESYGTRRYQGEGRQEPAKNPNHELKQNAHSRKPGSGNNARNGPESPASPKIGKEHNLLVGCGVKNQREERIVPSRAKRKRFHERDEKHGKKGNKGGSMELYENKRTL